MPRGAAEAPSLEIAQQRLVTALGHVLQGTLLARGLHQMFPEVLSNLSHSTILSFPETALNANIKLTFSILSIVDSKGLKPFLDNTTFAVMLTKEKIFYLPDSAHRCPWHIVGLLLLYAFTETSSIKFRVRVVSYLVCLLFCLFFFF